jgi:hypothetical protein
MATAAPAFEDYSILLRSGDAKLSRLALSGWQATAATLRTWSDRGRVWGKISPTSGDGYVQLFRRPGLAASDLLAHGTIAAGGTTATLTAQNASGISGSLDILEHDETATHLFDVIVSYADEQDIVKIYTGAANELDSNSKYEGLDTRFEAVLKEQKLYLDQLLWTRLKDQIGTDNLGRPNLGYIADPRQLARVHAKLCVSQLYERRGDLGSEIGQRFADAAKDAKTTALTELNQINILLDTNRDQVAEDSMRPGVIPVGRS